MTLGMVMDGGLTGAGDTVSPMVVNFIALWLVMLPAVWLLSTYWGWGVNGIWWGLVIGMGVQALLMTLRFRQGLLAAAAHLSAGSSRSGFRRSITSRDRHTRGGGCPVVVQRERLDFRFAQE